METPMRGEGVRISGGQMKGRKVRRKALGGTSRYGTLRATSSKVRESLFNIVGGLLEDAVFADLYAGTGAVGMEAMSRGAMAVYFVEADPRRAREIEALLDGCGCRSRAMVVRSSASAFLERAAGDGILLDVVFLDPPYACDELQKVMPLLAEGRVLAEDALVIAEHSSRKSLAEAVGVLRKRKSYKYGDTSLTVYVREP
jgi:16S rRNA (guanine966-N2)-methyltransferase